MTVRYGNAPALDDLFHADAASRPPSADPSWNAIPPVYSGGQADHPGVAVVFVNPTYRNQAARDGWDFEYRAPHIGFRRMWRFLASCGLIPELDMDMPGDGCWTRDVASDVYESAAHAGLYITNLVKTCRTTSAMPTAGYAREWLGLLRAELGMVQPGVVITMGGLVSSLVCSEPVKVSDVYSSVISQGKAVSRRLGLPGGHVCSVVPSYFPAGRGDPSRARAIIGRVARGLSQLGDEGMT